MKFCIIGIGKFGYEVATVLAENGVDILAIDQDESKVEHIRDKVSHAACIKIIDADSLHKIGIEEMDGVIIALIGSFTDTAILVRILRNTFDIKTIIACTNNQIKAEILEMLGADQIIKPEVEAAIRLADGLSAPFPQMTRLSERLAVVEVVAPDKFVGKPLSEILFYENYRVDCIAIRRDEDIALAINETIIEENDILFIAGFNETLQELEKEFK
jgi:trk system potassium uptake protein TrkA